VGILFIAKPPFLFGSRNKGTVDPIILPDDTMLPGIIDTEFEESLNSTMVMGDMAATAFSEPIWGHNQTHFNGTVWSYSQAPPPEPAFVIPQEILRLSGVVTGVLSAAFAASAMISIRKLNKMGAHMFQIVSYFHWVAIPYSLIVAPLLPKWIEPLPWILPTKVSTWALILVVSVSGIMSQLCLSQALKIEKAGKVASISYMQVIFAFIGEFVSSI
jgi:drug/metabolite transporter (DMT)-like permease